jgi:hypothetical protein
MEDILSPPSLHPFRIPRFRRFMQVLKIFYFRPVKFEIILIEEA